VAGTGTAHLHFDTDTYLDHETWVRPAFARLGDLQGKAALDYGCGHGMAAVVMARARRDLAPFESVAATLMASARDLDADAAS